MNKRPEALWLADNLASESSLFFRTQAAAELRRLHAANLDVLLHFNALKADYDKLRASNAELLAALELARDHLDMNALAFTHCKDAAAINAAIANATKDQE